ncbi:MAG: hypothetical protein OEY11_14560 [Gammaproteobacteria bacterium]|nr:hypothetical protein [Gammaproteobacteria bacterium]
MADFNKPIAGDGYAALLAYIVENNQSAIKLLDGVAALSNLPTNAKRWNAANKYFENWNGVAWELLATLYEMKVRNSDQLNGQTEAFYRNANNLNAGSLPVARFGDSSHGSRSGGSLHAVATTLLAGFMSSSDKSKLNGIENNATADQSAAEILALLLSVDGAGSGLDADLLDGWHRSSVVARANHTGTQTLATISDSGALAAKNSVAQGDIDANSVGQSEIKIATQVVAWSASTWATLIGGQYGLGTAIGTTSTSASAYPSSNDSTNNFEVYCQRGGVSGGSSEGSFYYINSSPPYNLGDGDIPMFVYAVIDNATGEIESFSSSVDPVWAYNGPTNIVPDRYGSDGRIYRQRRDMNKVPFSLAEAKAAADPAKLKAYLDAFSAAEIVEEEITQQMKNADMNIIPHPFMSNELAGKTVVMLDPMSPIMEYLLEMQQHDAGNVGEIINSKYLTIGNTQLSRKGPAGLLIPSVQWK